MCTLLVIRNVVADVPLILAANRDEFLQRPWTAPAVSEDGGLFAPRDGSAGGTWVGVNAHRLVDGVTNRDPMSNHPDRRSRGLLAYELLQRESLAAATEHLSRALREDPYNGFNLLLADRERAEVTTQSKGASVTVPLSDGVHVVTSTHDLDPPVLRGLRGDVQRAVQRAPDDRVATLADFLSDHYRHPDGYSVCKHHGPYGTSSASLIELRTDGGIDYWFAPGPPCTTPFTRLQVPL
jgi:uncharacterized protein with NRDE domain